MKCAGGSLVVVGIGIMAGFQTTIEAQEIVRGADRLLYLGGDGPVDAWLMRLNPRGESLSGFLEDAISREVAYERIAEHIARCVRTGAAVCVATYGHPGVFARPFHAAIARLTQAGYDARMLPAVSAEACLYADLGLDPGAYGAQSFEATDFLVYERRFDPTSLLLLWQIGVIAVSEQRADRGCWNRPALTILAEILAVHYGFEHEVVLYEAARYPLCRPIVHRAKIAELPNAPITTATTAILLPLPQRERNPHMMRRLEL